MTGPSPQADRPAPAGDSSEPAAAAPTAAPAGAVVPPRPSSLALRDTLIIARFELGESLRTRLFLVMVLLFMGGGGLSAWGLTKFLGRLEATAATTLGAPQSKKPGASLSRLHRTPAYKQLMRSAVSDPERAEYYTSLPPMVVFYAWIALVFTPWLVLFTASDTISTEVASRSIRYTLLRTGTLEYALGKLIGQGVLVFCVVGLCGLTFLLVSWTNLAGFDAGGTALGILAFWPRIFIHTLPFLGFALFASMMTSSANLARVTALGGGVVLAILSGMASSQTWRIGPVSNALWDLAQFLSPIEHSDGLMFPRGAGPWVDAAVCLALTVLYFGIGFLRLRRRDL